jgi:hypothetical protein
MQPDLKLICARRWPTGKCCGWHDRANELIRIRDGKRGMAEACPRCRSDAFLVEACMAAGCWRRHRRELNGAKVCREHFAELTAIMHDTRLPLETRIEAAGALLHQEREREQEAVDAAEDGERLH